MIQTDVTKVAATIRTLLGLIALIAGLSACGGEHSSGTASQPPSEEASAAVDSAPPGFLDPAPAPPESATLILSGGTLLDPAIAEAHPEGLFDAVVVVQDGKLLGFGKRGSVDVPNDSRGIDSSGRFLMATPGTALVEGEPVTLSVFKERPAEGVEPVAVLANGLYQPLIEADDD